jgi:hypothetical protein
MVDPIPTTPPGPLQASCTEQLGPSGLVRSYGFHLIAVLLGIALAIM